MKKIVKINVAGHISIAIDKILPFQGDLKTMSAENHKKLRNEILADGFNFSPHVWSHGEKYFILDGHQRISVMKQLKQDGYKFQDPDGNLSDKIPCNIVIAKDVNSAKRKVLQSVSQYGRLDMDGFKEFTEDVTFKMDDFDFLDFDMPDMPDMDLDEDFDKNENDPDEVPEVPQNAYGVKRGDVWLLGAYLQCEKCNQEFKIAEHKEGDKCPNCD